MINTLSTDLKDFDGEVWVFIPGYGSKYQVSNYGRVKSFIKRNPVILQKTISSGKYKVLLYFKVGRFKNELVGRLVCQAFNGEPKENDVVKYRDGNPFHDYADNVYWSSRKESVLNAVNKERYSHAGKKNGMAKLNEEKVNQIRMLRSQGKTYRELKDIFGVGITTIQSVSKGLTWKQ